MAPTRLPTPTPLRLKPDWEVHDERTTENPIVFSCADPQSATPGAARRGGADQPAQGGCAAITRHPAVYRRVGADCDQERGPTWPGQYLGGSAGAVC